MRLRHSSDRQRPDGPNSNKLVAVTKLHRSDRFVLRLSQLGTHMVDTNAPPIAHRMGPEIANYVSWQSSIKESCLTEPSFQANLLKSKRKKI